jgi:predicted aspartyl protease
MFFRSIAVSLVLAALAIPHAALGQEAWPQECKLVRMLQLPMVAKGNHVGVSGSVNGKTVTLAIDTGGYASALTKTAADALGLERHGLNLVTIRDMGGNFANEYVHVDSFKVGNLRRDRVDLLVMEALPGFDGLIAPDFLRNYDAELDFGSGTFNLFKHHPCADHAIYWSGTYAVIPFSMTEDGHMRVPVTLDGHDTYAVLDTGAGVSALSMQSARRLFDIGEDSSDVKMASQVTGASGSQLKAYTYPFKTLIMGGLTVANPRIELTEGSNFLGHNSASILLGMDVLSKLHLYIAYHEQKLYISDAQAR